MSISLLTNQSATIARDSLSTVGSNLQKSLNRLSSGSRIVSPSDDAGGLAVSMKMSAAIKRQSAASANISNAMSYLHTQDGAMDSASQILSRIGELKVLSSDITKNNNDRANYNTEFSALQEQLESLAEEKFNGISLFSSSAISVMSSSNGSGSTIEVGGVDLLESDTIYQDRFSGSSLSDDWTVNSGSASVNSGVLTLDAGQITLNQSFDRPVSVEVDMRLDNPSDLVDVYNNTQYYFSNYVDGSEVPGAGWHKMSFDLDTDGTMSSLELDGTDFSSATGTVATAPGAIQFSLWEGGGANGAEFRNLKITEQGSSTESNSASVSSAANLGALDMRSVKSSIEDISTFRAKNGAQQSQLEFAKELLDVNQSNLTAANSRIRDVDVAQESTELAKFSILQQAGISMLTQANQSQQLALKLIG